jgi:hypothetical protein
MGLRACTEPSMPVQGCTLPFTVSMFLTYSNSPTLAVAASKLDIYQMLCEQFELLMMGGKTA